MPIKVTPTPRHITSIIRTFKEATRVEMASQTVLQDMIEIFNKRSKSDLLLLKKCSDLKLDKHYIVHSLRRQDTTVGEGIVASLSETPYKEGDGPKFEIFLPRRFVSALQNEDLTAITPGTLYLVSHGSCGNNSTELSLHLVNTL